MCPNPAPATAKGPEGAFGASGYASADGATVEVLRLGLKNGSSTTVAGVRWRRASTVHSISMLVPGALESALTEASAITCFRIGLHVVLVALPTCRPRVYRG